MERLSLGLSAPAVVSVAAGDSAREAPADRTPGLRAQRPGICGLPRPRLAGPQALRALGGIPPGFLCGGRAPWADRAYCPGIPLPRKWPSAGLALGRDPGHVAFINHLHLSLSDTRNSWSEHFSWNGEALKPRTIRTRSLRGWRWGQRCARTARGLHAHEFSTRTLACRVRACVQAPQAPEVT